MSDVPPSIDWTAWSREAQRLMQSRNDAFVDRYGLADAHYRWNLDRAQMGFLRDADAVVTDLCFVGSVSDRAGTFLWGWANDAVPPRATTALDAVRAFGAAHDLRQLTTPEWMAQVPAGLEMLAVAGRLLDADAVWIERDGDRTILLTLHRARVAPLADHDWLTHQVP